MYRATLHTLDTSAAPGAESSRVAVICHCARELMNGLPAVFSSRAIPRPKPSSQALTAKLPKLLRKHPDLDLSVEQDLVPVPNAVAKAFLDLIRTAAKEDGRNVRNAAELVVGGSDVTHPAIKHWRDAQEFFVAWAHLDRNHSEDRQLPTDEELFAQLRVVEDVIEVRSAEFFETLRSLEDLLAEANATPSEETT